MKVFGRGVRLRTQIVLLQVVLVALTLGIAFGVFAYVSQQRLSGEYGQRALAIARTVAADPEVRAEVTRYSTAISVGPELSGELSGGLLERLAEATRIRTGALYVVITDDAGIRLAHPEISRLGQPVSTDPSAALGGAEVVIQERGTLGESVRAKVPVLQPDNERVVGEVSVGISTRAVHEQLLRDLARAAWFAAVALLAGVAGSLLLARRWHGLTLGLEPAELAELVREQDAVLHGIGEGVVAVDNRWRTTVVNDEARRLLGLGDAGGRPVDQIGLTPRVLEVFRAADGQPVPAAVGDRLVILTARTVSRDGRPLGAVLSVRDRTDVESLTRQLDAVRSLSTVLRAQRHEFANRLHLLSGLLHGGRPEEASQYIDELLGSGPLGAALPGMDAIRDPYLQAFLAAKAAHARESNVRLCLGPNTWVDANLVAPVEVTTVLGNLIDNAIEAARTGSDAAGRGIGGAAAGEGDADAEWARHPVMGGPAPSGDGNDGAVEGSGIDAAGDERQVEVELVQERSTLHIAVADSGPGVSPELAESVFTEGVSTKADNEVPGGRGVGLALSRQVARALGGDVVLAHPGGRATVPGGAEFIARLPGVLVEGETVWAQSI
ncbi:ATP-binding protein [Nocardia sp. CDC159]|uniref:Sensor-like histidine kinase SenX3 n=1 Tax=Nocardia pulmonis TaxID=2951408 RepID=A0A9X2E2Y5_9NOCA|nr:MULTISPECIES: ATP-binding protein [Nocardia]MCM6773294.1 ATP-binding protein [Nocardia pulmonis]MCM6786181.1 ATP-binding protein [Nocardia sp. CDC159]